MQTVLPVHPVLGAITQRRSANTAQMTEPGPTEEAMLTIVEAAAAAPDHGRVVPFRFVELLPAARARLADAAEQAVAAINPCATTDDRERARKKMLGGPSALALVGHLQPSHPKIILSDQWLAIGCALQNIVLAAEALGFGVAMKSANHFSHQIMSAALGLQPGEELLCLVAIGTASAKPPARIKPVLSDVFRRLEA